MKNSKFIQDPDFVEARINNIHLKGEHVKVLSNWVLKPSDFLCFFGSPGIGKTYFCSAFYNYITQEKKKHCIILSERDFLSGLKDCFNQGWDCSYEIDKIKEAEYFILDDLGSCNNTDWYEEVIFSLIDERHSCRKPTIITSNLYLNDIKKKYNPRFFSRLADRRNHIVELQDKDRRQDR